MSMICNLRRAGVGDVERLLAAPERITAFLYGAEPAPPAPPAGSGGGLLSRLFGGKSRTAGPDDWRARADGDEIDIDKTWHGLHFLFTGTAWQGEPPASFLVVGGHVIGDVDVGYGPARALMPDDVARFADFLSSVDDDELGGRYDPGRMTQLKIYPETWAGADADEEIGYLLDGLARLRAFVSAAREAGDAIVIWLS